MIAVDFSVCQGEAVWEQQHPAEEQLQFPRTGLYVSTLFSLGSASPSGERGKEESETGEEGPYTAGENVGFQNHWQ